MADPQDIATTGKRLLIYVGVAVVAFVLWRKLR